MFFGAPGKLQEGAKTINLDSQNLVVPLKKGLADIYIYLYLKIDTLPRMPRAPRVFSGFYATSNTQNKSVSRSIMHKRIEHKRFPATTKRFDLATAESIDTNAPKTRLSLANRFEPNAWKTRNDYVFYIWSCYGELSRSSASNISKRKLRTHTSRQRNASKRTLRKHAIILSLTSISRYSEALRNDRFENTFRYSETL